MSLRAFVKLTWKLQVLVLLISVILTHLELQYFNQYVEMSPTAVAVLGTALAFFIGFINSQAYDRWWEARKVWGAIVNDSRSLGRMVLSLMQVRNAAEGSPDELRHMQTRLIHRQIAWLYATKERLRDIDQTLHRNYLTEKELAEVDHLDHIPNGIQLLQGQTLDEAHAKGYIDGFRLMELNAMLNRFSDSIGMCERIKNTVFPVSYAMLTRLSIWTFVILLPMTLAEKVGYWSIPLSFIIGVVYELTFLAGQKIMNPFSNQPSDTPMSAITRTIEINLLEMLGQSPLPEPVEPVEGEYLM